MYRAQSLAVLILLLSLVGCATGPGGKDNVQRAAAGPTSDEIFNTRFQQGYHRQPTFEESTAFRVKTDNQIADYFAKHPGLSTSERASLFTFYRRVLVGMDKDEVVLLAGLPTATTEDRAQMQAAAQQFWSDVSQHAKQMWTYPGGWQFYFDGDHLVDLTVTGKPPL